MTPVIRIDDGVMNELKKRAIGLDLVFDSPNTVLRRILGLDVDAKRLVDHIVGDALKKYAKNAIELELTASSRKYVYIPLPRGKRHFFPGYKENFELVTDVETFTAHVTSAPTNGIPIGDLNTGGHIRGRFGAWYAKHPELKAGDKLRIEALEPGKRYKLSTS